MGAAARQQTVPGIAVPANLRGCTLAMNRFDRAQCTVVDHRFADQGRGRSDGVDGIGPPLVADFVAERQQAGALDDVAADDDEALEARAVAGASHGRVRHLHHLEIGMRKPSELVNQRGEDTANERQALGGPRSRAQQMKRDDRITR